MAGRIKGITVEIGGDTTGLEKALKNVNSTIKNTQSQLKDVNRLLKLDPSNTELLSQKQRALKDAIGATKEKLDSLKTAQEQAKQQLENGDLGQDKYDALQREIIETEQELRRLQEEAAATSTALAKIDEAGKKMEAFGDSVTSAGQKIMPASMAVAGLRAAAMKTAADFDSGMSKVAAISGATGDDLDALRDKAREMGAKTKFSASEAASAMEYMAMAGWKTEDMLGGIEGIMSLAAASGEDLATTSDIVTDALTAFGLSAQDSGHFADILAAASSNANTNVRMMGETFKYCAPIAGALGFSAEDVAEAIGLMANAGIKSTQAGTALRTIMNNLSGEVKITGAALGEVTIATTNADGSMRDLSDILADCRGAFSQLSESERAQAAEALVGKNAMSGFLALMNAAPEDIEKLSTAIDNCDGTAAQMAETMQDNLAGQLTILKSQLEELAISFGEMLMPAIRAIVSKIQAFVDKLNGMSESQRKAILTIGLIVAALGPLLVIIGTLISKVGIAMQGFVKLATGVKKLGVAVKAGTGVFGKLGAALGGISGPVLAIVAVVAVLIAAFKHLWDTNEEFRNAITGIWEGIVSKIQA
ncbi:MAG: phage tail tape measure protein, partial [Oscillospiraceae bacterium]|nr:phage tail tape measure protein [Oscillospiraceae bacterium]